MEQEPPLSWIPFELDGLALEYVVVATKYKMRPADWPANKASPGDWITALALVVRLRGRETGPAMLFPSGTVITIEHAHQAARAFRDSFFDPTH